MDGHGNHDHVEAAQRKYLQAEKETNENIRRTLFLQSAENYLAAAEILTSLDQGARAGLIFLATVAMKRASSDPGMSPNEDSHATTHDNLSSYQDRTMTYSTIRSKISGVKKVPKSMAASKQNHVQDIFLLQSKLADIGILKGSSLQPSYMPINSNMYDMQSSTRNLSSALGESFMLLNQSMMKGGTEPRRIISKPISHEPHQTSSEGKTKIASSSDHKLSQSPIPTPIKSIQRQSTAASPQSSSKSNDILSPSPSWAGVLGGILGFAASDVGGAPIADSMDQDQYSPNESRPWKSSDMDHMYHNPVSDARLITNTNAMTHVRSSSNWINQSTFSIRDGNMNESHMTGSSQQSITGAARYGNNPMGNVDSSALMNEVIRLQKSMKTLGEENSEMHEKLTSQLRIAEQNKLFRRDMEIFRREYDEKYEKLKQSLSDFAARYPGKDNPANVIIGPPSRAAHTQDTTTINISSTTNVDDTASKDSSNDRVKQLELAVQRLLAKVEQKESKLKKYEDYYQKQKAKSEERKKSIESKDGTIATATGSQPSPIAVGPGSMSAFAMNRRQPPAKHPSTLTLETSIQRNQSKNVPG